MTYGRQRGPYWCTPCQRDFLTPEAWDRHLAEHREQRREFQPLQAERKAPAQRRNKEVKA
jgi:hypothetical protein